MGEMPSKSVECPTTTANYWVNTYHASLDKAILEISARFEKNDQAVVCALAYVQYCAVQMMQMCSSMCTSRLPKDESFLKFSNFCGLDKEMLRAEKKIHVNYRIEEEDNAGNTIASSLAKNLCLNGLHAVLPEFYRAFSTLATIPATSCSTELSFSGLRRMKTYLQERLTNTSLMNIEGK